MLFVVLLELLPLPFAWLEAEEALLLTDLLDWDCCALPPAPPCPPAPPLAVAVLTLDELPLSFTLPPAPPWAFIGPIWTFELPLLLTPDLDEEFPPVAVAVAVCS